MARSPYRHLSCPMDHPGNATAGLTVAKHQGRKSRLLLEELAEGRLIREPQVFGNLLDGQVAKYQLMLGFGQQCRGDIVIDGLSRYLASRPKLKCFRDAENQAVSTARILFAIDDAIRAPPHDEHIEKKPRVRLMATQLPGQIIQIDKTIHPFIGHQHRVV